MPVGILFDIDLKEIPPLISFSQLITNFMDVSYGGVPPVGTTSTWMRCGRISPEPMEVDDWSYDEQMEWEPVDTVEPMEWEESFLPPQVDPSL
ncbi:hypothetical protein AVEN_85289-1 [Araneus ventricosus]|uniref:Uncharacterized protein n=1 Tax=Araneus ventricosus TaxID=182803 RepID=A0A4Y2Q5Q8_ARAVE|nr:hypothetical protein AVEN_85289-1 [Araneus ventricosus]